MACQIPIAETAETMKPSARPIKQSAFSIAGVAKTVSLKNIRPISDQVRPISGWYNRDGLALLSCRRIFFSSKP